MNEKNEQTDSVQLPVIRLSNDEHAKLSSLVKRMNWLKHNPTPDHPIQGRKRGEGRNRATKRGKRAAQEKAPAKKGGKKR